MNWTEVSLLYESRMKVLRRFYFIKRIQNDDFSSGFILHKTAKAVHLTLRRISEVGIRNRTSTFPKYCEEEQRLKRCKNEPKCEKILNCLRKGYYTYIQVGPGHNFTKIALKVLDITQDISKMILDALKAM